MKTTGEFHLHEVRVKAKPGQRFTFIPFGDVHRDAPSFANEHWAEFLARGEQAAKYENALFLGMGDYIDCASTSERTIIGDDRLHESTRHMIENHARGAVTTLTNELSFMRGRLMGLLGGNHYMQFHGDATSDHLLAANLGAKFLGVCAFVRVIFEDDSRMNKKGHASAATAIDIFAHHGRGGGVLCGSPFNVVQKMQDVADADIYLMGHDHSKGVIPARPRLRLTSGGGGLAVKERTPALGRTGSFLKAYEPGMPNYNVDACRPPAALGWIEFGLTYVRDRSNGKDITSVRIDSAARIT